MFFNKKFTVAFASEAEPQLFLACSQFLGKSEPRCSYKFVLIKKARTSAWVGSPKGPYKQTNATRHSIVNPTMLGVVELVGTCCVVHANKHINC